MESIVKRLASQSLMRFSFISFYFISLNTKDWNREFDDSLFCARVCSFSYWRIKKRVLKTIFHEFLVDKVDFLLLF